MARVLGLTIAAVVLSIVNVESVRVRVQLSDPLPSCRWYQSGHTIATACSDALIWQRSLPTLSCEADVHSALMGVTCRNRQPG